MRTDLVGYLGRQRRSASPGNVGVSQMPGLPFQTALLVATESQRDRANQPFALLGPRPPKDPRRNGDIGNATTDGLTTDSLVFAPEMDHGGEVDPIRQAGQILDHLIAGLEIGEFALLSNQVALQKFLPRADRLHQIQRFVAGNGEPGFDVAEFLSHPDDLLFVCPHCAAETDPLIGELGRS